jgi:hypothetical protein
MTSRGGQRQVGDYGLSRAMTVPRRADKGSNEAYYSG